MNVFEQAILQRVRFSTNLGNLTTEDLTTLKLTQLDTIASSLYKELQETKISFIGDNSKEDKLAQLKLDIVKKIIEIKLADQATKEKAKEIAANREVLLEALANKRIESIKNLSEEELLQKLASLG